MRLRTLHRLAGLQRKLVSPYLGVRAFVFVFVPTAGILVFLIGEISLIVGAALALMSVSLFGWNRRFTLLEDESLIIRGWWTRVEIPHAEIAALELDHVVLDQYLALQTVDVRTNCGSLVPLVDAARLPGRRRRATMASLIAWGDATGVTVSDDLREAPHRPRESFRLTRKPKR